MNEGIIAKATEKRSEQVTASKSINVMLNSILDGEKMRNRFDELLGKRTPQFLSSLTTLINGDENLKAAFYQSPMTVIQAALKAASYDLPIDPSLGFAYIVPFKNSKKSADGSFVKVMEAQYIPGYKGLIQLCLRTGAYSRIPDAVDVRDGELIHYDRLTGDAEFKWEEDEDARENLPVIGYVGYFRLKNGAEKTIYMTLKQIEAHEKKHRKSQYMSKGWRDDFDAMARKTVIRRLVSKYGLMSIEYQNGDNDTVRLAHAIMEEDAPEYADADVIDSLDTGEVLGENAEAAHAE